MSRSGYSYDCEGWQFAMWRGAVASAFRGRRGQAFLRELLAALDALPEKRLVKNELQTDGAVCALGAVGKARGLDMAKIDPDDHEGVATKFDVAHAMACESMYENDEFWRPESPEGRFHRMRRWIASQIKEAVA